MSSIVNTMWKYIHDFLFEKKIYESITVPTPDDLLQEAIQSTHREELVNDFLEVAISRYCSVCDEFFKRPHSLLMHKRSKDHLRKEEEYGQIV